MWRSMLPWTLLFIGIGGLQASLTAQTQTLVPNGSFEVTNGLPCGVQEPLGNYLSYWSAASQAAPSLLSLDSSPACWAYPGTGSTYTGPGCWPGELQPHSGRNMVGLKVYQANSGTCSGVYSDYLQVKLGVSLQPEWHCIDFWVALSPEASLATNNLGVFLSTVPLSENTCGPLRLQPAWVSTELIDQPGQWVRMTTTLFADSGYQYLIIGKFDETGSLQLKNMGGCEELGAYYFVDDVNVRSLPPQGFLGPDISLCPGDNYPLNAFLPGARYLWQDGFTGPVYRVEQPGNYQLTMNVLGCVLRDTVQVYYAPRPAPDLGRDTLICEGGKVELALPEDSTLQYSWQDGRQGARYSITAAGLYWVEAANACETVRDSLLVGVQPCECYLQMPSAFSPNADGVNDLFGPIYDCVVFNARLRIWNRWGKEVFASSSIDGQWDGTSGGSPAPEGVYLWVLEYEGMLLGQPRKRRMTGVVTVWR